MLISIQVKLILKTPLIQERQFQLKKAKMRQFPKQGSYPGPQLQEHQFRLKRAKFRLKKAKFQ